MRDKIVREYNKNGNKKTEVLNIRVSANQKKQLKDIGEKLQLNQSEVLRLAIEKIINEHYN